MPLCTSAEFTAVVLFWEICEGQLAVDLPYLAPEYNPSLTYRTCSLCHLKVPITNLGLNIAAMNIYEHVVFLNEPFASKPGRVVRSQYMIYYYMGTS